METPDMVPVITSLVLLVQVPAWAVKEADVAPLPTVMEAGTVTIAVLEARLTAMLEDAAPLSVAMQLVEPPEARLVEEQAIEASVGATGGGGATGAVSEIATDFEPLPRVAVIVAVWLAEIVPATAVKLAEVVFAATATDASGVKRSENARTRVAAALASEKRSNCLRNFTFSRCNS